MNAPAKIAGWYTWLHHDIPIEWTDDLAKRLAHIKEWKPAEEIPVRLAAIVRVTDDRIPQTYINARRACIEAGLAYDEATRAYGEARRAYDEATRAYGEAARATDLLALAAECAPDAPVTDGKLLVGA